MLRNIDALVGVSNNLDLVESVRILNLNILHSLEQKIANSTI
jgi:hypothetical protein